MASTTSMFQRQIADYIGMISDYAKFAPEYKLIKEYLTHSPLPQTTSARADATARADFAYVYDYYRGQQHLAAPAPLYPHEVFEKLSRAPVGGGRLIFLRGLPNLEILRSMGAFYNIDPEFFRRHLDFLGSSSQGTAGRPPPAVLPSTSRTIVQLRIPMIGCHSRPFKSYKVDDLKEARVSTQRQMSRYLKEMRRSTDWTPGQMMARDHEVFDEQYFSIDQRVTIYRNVDDSRLDHWLVIVWFDSSNTSKDTPQGPWDQGYGTDWLKPLRYTPRIALRPEIWLGRTGTQGLGFQEPTFTGRAYGRTLSPDAMAVSPFYALRKLFDDSVASQGQLFNLIDSKLAENDQALSVEPQNDSLIALLQANTLYSQALLEAHVQGLKIAHNFVDHQTRLLDPLHRGTNTRHPLSDELFGTVTEATGDPTKDFQFLIATAENLSKRCERMLATALSNASIAESKRGIRLSRSMSKFTVFAAVCVPLSFITSFFGMNFVQFGQGPLDLRLFFYASLPLLCLSIAVMILDIEAIWMRLLKAIQQLMGNA